MPYFKSSQEWLEKSALLIDAHPSTTRITTKYSIKAVKARTRSTRSAGLGVEADGPAQGLKPPCGSLTIKTYDPISGVTLKYHTTKAAEVSRLVQASLGRLGRRMAALPDEPPQENEALIPVTDQCSWAGKNGQESASQNRKAQPPPQPAGGGRKRRGRK